MGQPLLVLAQPTNQFVRPGGEAVFRVVAAGNNVLRYQWLFNGSPIPPANGVNDTLTPVGNGTDQLILTGPGPSFCTDPSNHMRESSRRKSLNTNEYSSLCP